MRKTIALGALAALIATPLILGPTDASASCKSRKTTGTVLGGVGGALLGNSISHGGGGAVLGGIGGAVVGHEIGRSGCNRGGRTYYRSSRHSNYASAPQPSRAVRKVYYDQYGNPVGSSRVYEQR
jgi:uncharacterized protein YcfJ